MVFLTSHVVCSGSSTLQFSLLQILNDPSIEAPQAIKLKAQSLQPLLERCMKTEYITPLLAQEPQLDVEEFKRRLVEIVGPGSSTAQINILFELIRCSSTLAPPACQQLSVIFPTTGQNTQLQIAKLLFDR